MPGPGASISATRRLRLNATIAPATAGLTVVRAAIASCASESRARSSNATVPGFAVVSARITAPASPSITSGVPIHTTRGATSFSFHTPGRTAFIALRSAPDMRSFSRPASSR